MARRDNFWKSFNDAYQIGRRVWLDDAANREQQAVAEAYRSAYGLGAASPEDYSAYADKFAETNPEAAAIYRDAADRASAGEAAYVPPTDAERKSRGLGAISDYYYKSGDIDKALAFDKQRLLNDELIANRAWKNKEQARTELLWGREDEDYARKQQLRDALREAENYSPQAYEATMQRLKELGPEGEAARNLYNQYFTTSYQTAVRNAADRLRGLGALSEANALEERLKRMKDEGVDLAIELIRSGASPEVVMKAFNAIGTIRLDEPPQITKLKNNDYSVRYVSNGKVGFIPSINQLERELIPVDKRAALELNEAYKRYLMQRPLTSTGLGNKPQILGVDEPTNSLVVFEDGKVVFKPMVNEDGTPMDAKQIQWMKRLYSGAPSEKPMSLSDIEKGINILSGNPLFDNLSRLEQIEVVKRIFGNGGAARPTELIIPGSEGRSKPSSVKNKTSVDVDYGLSGLNSEWNDAYNGFIDWLKSLSPEERIRRVREANRKGLVVE